MERIGRDMRDLISRIEEMGELLEGRKIGYRPRSFYDDKIERHILTAVAELKALAKKGTGEEVAAREEKIFASLIREMQNNSFTFLMSMLNILGAGSKHKREVLRSKG